MGIGPWLFRPVSANLLRSKIEPTDSRNEIQFGMFGWHLGRAKWGMLIFVQIFVVYALSGCQVFEEGLDSPESGIGF